MTSKVIEEKKEILQKEENELNEKLQLYYTELGKLLSTELSAGREGEDLDFSVLAKEPVKLKIKNCLKDVDRSVLRLEEIIKEKEELESLKICPKCGTVVDEDELFCAVCGERLIKETVNTDDNVCPQCGKPKKSEAAFCVFCGFRFDAAKEEPVSEEPVIEEHEESGRQFCVKCGTKLPDDVQFCHICGYKLY